MEIDSFSLMGEWEGGILMIINYNSERDPSGHLIEDIVPRQAEPYIDVRNSKVRRSSIGALDQQYLFSRMRGAPKVVPVKSVSSGYTRVPPLQSLPDAYLGTDGHLAHVIDAVALFMAGSADNAAVLLGRANRATRRYLRKIGRELKGLSQLFTGAALALVAWLTSIDLAWSRRGYTAGSGLATSKILKRAKTVLPALLALLVVAVTVLAWPGATRIQVGGQSQKLHGSAGASGSSQSLHASTSAARSKIYSGSNSPVKTINPSLAPVSGLNAQTTNPSTVVSPTTALPATATAPSVGGYGGGTIIPVVNTSTTTSPTQTTSTTSTSTSTTTSTTPTSTAPSSPTQPVTSTQPAPTVSVPSTSVNLGGQTVLSTPSVGL